MAGRPRREEPPRIDAVLDAAMAEFLERGFDAARIEDVAQRAGASKGTIYRHFESKEALFQAAVAHLLRSRRAAFDEAFARRQSTSVEGALLALAGALLTSLTDPTSVALFRVVIAQAHRNPAIGQFLWTELTEIGAARIAGYLEALRDAGSLAIADPQLAAFHFLGLLKEALFWPVVLGVDAPVLAASREEAVRGAVGAFLRAYAPAAVETPGGQPLC